MGAGALGIPQHCRTCGGDWGRRGGQGDRLCSQFRSETVAEIDRQRHALPLPPCGAERESKRFGVGGGRQAGRFRPQCSTIQKPALDSCVCSAGQTYNVIHLTTAFPISPPLDPSIRQRSVYLFDPSRAFRNYLCQLHRDDIDNLTHTEDFYICRTNHLNYSKQYLNQSLTFYFNNKT